MAYTLYWCVYPAGGTPPTAAQIIGESYAGGFFGNDSAPTETSNDWLGSQVSGLDSLTDYRLAAVANDGTNSSNVIYSAVWQTLSPLASYNVYWCIYPAAGTPPTASEIIGETYAGGIFGSDTAPTSTTNDWFGSELTGVTPGTSYRLASVANNGTYSSNVLYSDVFIPTGFGFTANAGAFTLAGGDVTFSRTLILSAEAGAFTLTGGDATFASGFLLGADAGSYALIGGAVTFSRNYQLQANAGTFTLTGGDVALSKGWPLTAEAGAFALTGGDVSLDLTYLLSAEAGAYHLSGKVVDFDWSGALAEITSNKFFYAPSGTGYGVDQNLSAFLYREHSRIADALNQGHILPLFFKEPEKLTNGTTVLADGQYWNPGHGRGMYVYVDGSWLPGATIQTYWDDEKAPAIQIKRGSNLKPDFDYTQMAMMMPQNDPSEILYLSNQLSHSMKIGTSAIYPHVHYLDSGGGTPTFKIDYRFYNNGTAADAAFTTISTDDGSGPVFSYTSGTILQIIPFEPVALLGMLPSMYYDIRLYRDDNVVAGDVPLKSFDFHYERDFLGSREEFTK